MYGGTKLERVQKFNWEDGVFVARSISIHVVVLLALLYVYKGLEHVLFYDLPSFVALF